MNNRTWALFVILVGLVAILSSSTSFFYFKSRSLDKKEDTASSEVAGSIAESTSAPNASATTKAIASSQRPSSPADTHKVEKDETLFTIAQKYNQTWTEIVAANGLEDANKIMVGQVLIIPQNEVVNFQINQENAEKLQKAADSGQNLLRLDPLQVAKADASPVYGISNTDEASLKSKENGEAVVIVKREGETYQIKLTQPATKGEKGIWAITSIAPVR